VDNLSITLLETAGLCFCLREERTIRGMGRRMGPTKLQIETVARLLGEDGRSAAEVALSLGLSRSAIYMRRRRLQQSLGVRIPWPHKMGRPPAAMKEQPAMSQEQLAATLRQIMQKNEPKQQRRSNGNSNNSNNSRDS